MLGLLRSNHGEFCNLCVFFNEIWWFRFVGHSDCYSFVNYVRHWVGNQQICCFRKLLQRWHSACSIPIWWMVNEGCDCFCCLWWYGQGVVSDDWLWFGGGLLEAVLICIVKWGKCMSPCVESKCNPMIGPVNFFIMTKCSANELSPIINFSVAVHNGFSNWPLATCIWKLGGSSILRMLLGAFCLIDSKSSWAIALTNSPKSTRASTVRLFSKYRGT